ncbi:MAG: hypothetical protein AAFU41_05855 [Pseudomonadota bacterium]
MIACIPTPKRASEVIRLREIKAQKQAYFDVVGGLSEQHLSDLEGALERCSEQQDTFPEAIQFVLRRVKCIEDADRIVEKICSYKPDEEYAIAA